MSLVGNLEDLGLGDILQIVSLSKKSGVLLLASGQREGIIVFNDGQVVRAVTSQFKSTLGDILLRHKLLSSETLDQAIAEQTSGGHPSLSSLLVSKYNISFEKIQAIIKAQIERTVYSFFAWDEGTFDFQLAEDDALGAARFSSQEFVLEQGLNPQWLVAEGRRMLAEGRLVSLDSDDFPLGEVPCTDSSLPVADLTENRCLFIIIDDDGPMRSVLKKAFTVAGFEVEVFALTSALLMACNDRVSQGQRPALLIDLIMPRLDGHGILGGLEVMEIVADKYPDLPMLLMSDHPNAEAERRARELGGIAVLRKPKKFESREGPGVESLKNLLLEVERYVTLTGSGPRREAGTYDIGKDLIDEFDATEQQGELRSEGSPGLHLLKGMLQELANPLLSGGVILLILRFASELLSRAVIFNVKGSEIVGIGQFGLDATTENADRMVRKLRLDVDPDSLFAQVIQQKSAAKGVLGSCASDRELLACLGGVEPAEIFIGPLISEGEVVAVIYGDNLPDASPVGNVEAFEVFLSQAGMAMGKVLLERGAKDSS
jgi:CheY-like chemotaxis protein